MSFKSEFSPTQERKLVEMVERHPCIYEVSSLHYKDPHMKDMAWKDIAKRVGRPAEQCKWRWRNIKDTFVKRKRKSILGTESSSSSSSQKKWHLATMLKFLDDIQFKKRNVTNSALNNAQNVEFIDVHLNVEKNSKPELSTETTSGNLNKRNTRNGIKPNKMADINIESNRIEIKTEKSEKPEMTERPERTEKSAERVEITDMLGYQEDHVDVFFRSVALSVKAFPRHLISQAKLRTLQMLVELEGKCLSNNQNHFNVSSNCLTAYTNTYDEDNSSS